MKYKVIKPFGVYKEGDIVDKKNLYIRRKIQEGGCLEPVEKKAYENKMQKGSK